jgi:hypothetical protein
MLAQRVILCGDYRSYVVLSESIERLNENNPELPPVKYRIASGATKLGQDGARYVELLAHSPARLLHLEDYLTELSDKAKKLNALLNGEEEPEEPKKSGVQSLFELFLGSSKNPQDEEVNHKDEHCD